LFDSTWEVALAKRLDDLTINWVRNKDALQYKDQSGANRRYYPDFYIPEHNAYIEVKGYATEATRHKMTDAIKRNSIKLIILWSLNEIEQFTYARLVFNSSTAGFHPASTGAEPVPRSNQ